MCGITGVLGQILGNSISLPVMRMTDSLQHRGPDDGDIWVDEEAHIALGHRRLSILDLSPEGHQPMLSRDGRYVIVLNGEIYNHQALRKELEEKNSICWRGHSDTEILLAGISEWGIESAISKLVGMFAFALWDRTEHRLHLVRDRMGEKPLYYAWCNGAFIFGSELKALTKYPGFTPEINRDSLTLFLRHMAIPAPFTIYRRVYKLQPGCILSLGLDEAPSPVEEDNLQAPFRISGLHLRSWWSLKETTVSSRESLITDEAEAISLLESRLRDTIRFQSLADVPLGSFLSGGVDSSLITSLMQLESSAPVKTFTIGFQEERYNEADHASAIARHLGTEHTELFVTAKDALDAVQRLPYLYDEPFADSSQIPTFLLCSQAKKHVTVALSGDAGDELFGGYNRYLWVSRIWKKLSRIPEPSRHFLLSIILALPPRHWDAIYALIKQFLPTNSHATLVGDKLHKLADCLIRATTKDALYHNLTSEWKNPEKVVIDALEPFTLFKRSSDWPVLPEIEDRMMFLDAMTYLPDDILVKIDRAAMGASLETRTPFLDHRVVELAWRLPLSMKMRNGQGKWALRQILYKYVPKDLIERPKQGFGIPLGDWLRGPLREWAEELLSVERLNREGFFHPAPIRLKWMEHLSGTRNWEHSLWAVLMFQSWLDANR